MISQHLLDEFQDSLDAVVEIHRIHPPIRNRHRPKELIRGIRSLCQRQIDIMLQLGRETGATDSDYLRFVKLLETYHALVQAVLERGDLSDDDDEIVICRDHAAQRIEATQSQLEDRHHHQSFIRSHLFSHST